MSLREANKGFEQNGAKPQAADDALVLEGVGVVRGERWILRDVSWSVPRGSCVAVLGPNGSGKSTLARVLLGYLWASVGSVSVDGQKFGETNLATLRERVRLVQPAGPFEIDVNATALDVVLTGKAGTLDLHGEDLIDDRAHATTLIERVGLTHVVAGRWGELSTGEKMRTLVARALFGRPSLLILDEPTGGLDLRAREQLLGVLDRLTTSDAPDRPTVIVITHHLEELPRSTADVLLLSEGRVAARGTMAEVLRDDVLGVVYGCPVRVTRSGGRYAAQVAAGEWDALL